MKISRAILLFICLLLLLIVLMHRQLFRGCYSFLAITKPVEARVLVIEDWLFDYMLEEAAREFIHGNYTYCLLSGKKPDGSAEALLEKAGVDKEKIKRAHSHNKSIHRTIQSAIHTKEWLSHNDPHINCFNIFSDGSHGRKTWVVYRRVFGPNYNIGIISADIKHWDVQRWWTSRKGIRVLAKHTLGYLYALIWPIKQDK